MPQIQHLTEHAQCLGDQNTEVAELLPLDAEFPSRHHSQLLN